MNYTLVSFQSISEEQKELLIAILPEFGFHGMEETEQGIKAYTTETDTDFDGLLTVSNQLGVEFQLETLEKENWNKTWESNFDPVVILGKVQVRAHFHPPLDSVEHQILITPKMSFGTGHHPTTRMMMLAMLETDFHGKRVIDFGTGTGILSILAEKLGGIHIEAIDNDDWSINNVIENIELNDAKAIQVIKASTLNVSAPADVVLANINKNVLIEHVHDLFKYTRENGVLIISGLLRTDYEDMLEVFVPVFGPLSKSYFEGDWLAMSFELKV